MTEQARGVEAGLLALTWVHSGTGGKIPAQQIAEAVRPAIVVVDGVHGLAADDLRIDSVDVLVAEHSAVPPGDAGARVAADHGRRQPGRVARGQQRRRPPQRRRRRQPGRRGPAEGGACHDRVGIHALHQRLRRPQGGLGRDWDVDHVEHDHRQRPRRVAYSGDGLQLGGTAAVVRGNTITGNGDPGPYEHGVYTGSASKGWLIEKNTISGSGGANVKAMGTGTVRGNRLVDGRYGLVLASNPGAGVVGLPGTGDRQFPAATSFQPS